jgi:hypothetical protein
MALQDNNDAFTRALLEGITDTLQPKRRLKANNGAGPETASPNLCTPFAWRDPATLPKRGWLYGRHYIRQHVSGSIGEGGVGKSTQAMTEAVAMVTNRPLLGKTPSTALRVWYWNGEDPKSELELRFAAICQRFDIDGHSLVGKLFVDGRASPMRIAAINQKGAVTLDATVIADITDRIRANAIDVWIVDPFVACHSVSENDNVAVDVVIKALGRIAEETNCAIDIVHHPRKAAPGQESLTIGDSRGASAIVYGVRSGRIFNQMTTTEAEKAGLNPDHRRAYFRVDRTKVNMAPPEHAIWHHLIPVTLPNGEEVAAVERWEFPDMFEGVTTAHMHAVRAKAQEQDYRADVRSKDWIGYAVIDALNLGRSAKDITRAKNIIRKWIENGVLTKVEKQDPKYRKAREFVVPGNWNEG